MLYSLRVVQLVVLFILVISKEIEILLKKILRHF